VAEPSRVKVRRHRLHKRGDHTECLATCRLAGTVERDDVAGLRQAIEAEFAGDPARLAIPRRHVEQAAQRGQPAVAAVVALDRMVEASRAGRYTPVYNGPVTIDDEIRALADELVNLEVAQRLTELAGRQWRGPVERETLPALIDELLAEIRGVR
jgi:hypothetical protein